MFVAHLACMRRRQETRLPFVEVAIPEPQRASNAPVISTYAVRTVVYYVVVPW